MNELAFGRWTPLLEAKTGAPTSPGVFQVKIVDGLLDYPSGKSAMIHYDVGSNLREAIAAFADGHPPNDWVVRHVELAFDDATFLAKRLVDAFETRFGEKPRIP